MIQVLTPCRLSPKLGLKNLVGKRPHLVSLTLKEHTWLSNISVVLKNSGEDTIKQP